jgi:hypothetical protein
MSARMLGAFIVGVGLVLMAHGAALLLGFVR